MKLNIERVKEILKLMQEAQNEHPKSEVVWDGKSYQITITYPLPKDFWDIEKFTATDDEFIN